MATYYWVGGAGTWDASSTTNWSATSGGAGGAGVPNNTDTALFDALSGTGVVSVAATAVSATTTVNNSGIELNLTGSPTLSIESNNLNFTSGVLTLNSFTLTCGRFASSNANSRTINFGTGSINITGNGATVFTISIVTNLTITGTSKVDFTYSGSVETRTIIAAVTDRNQTHALNYNITAGTDTISGGIQYATNLNFTGFSGTLTNNTRSIFGDLTFSSGMTITATSNGTTFVATAGVQKLTTNGQTLDNPVIQNAPGATLQLQDNLTMGSTRAFTLTNGSVDLNNFTLNAGIFSSSNSNARSIAFGTGNITVTGNNITVFSMSTVTNFTYTGTPTVNATYSGATGTRSFRFGSGATGINVLNINISAGSDAVNANSVQVKNINFTGFAGTLQNGPLSFYGNLTFSSGMSLDAGSGTLRSVGTVGTQQITTAGKTLDFPIIVNAPEAIVAFQDALTQGSTRAFSIDAGTVQLKNGVTSTVGAFATSGTNQKFLRSTLAGSQATISQASGTVTVSDLTIQDSNAVGGASWTAYADYENVDAGNNDGWNFSLSPPYASYEPPIIIRSFTQPRRF